MTMSEREIQPMRADRLKDHILGLMVPTASELVVASGLTPQQVKDDVRDYKKAGFLYRAEIGSLLPGVPLLWPTPLGLDHMGASQAQRSWFREAGLSNLFLFDLPKLEAVKQISVLCSTDEQPIAGIHFYEGLPMIAAADHHRPGDDPNYAIFLWVPLISRERDLYHKLESLPDAMNTQLVAPDRIFYPGRVCIVAHDEWDATVALKLVNGLPVDWFIRTHILAWYYRNGSWYVCDADSLHTGRPPTALRPMAFSVGRLRPTTSTRKEYAKVEGLLTRSLWSGRAGQGLFTVLTSVGKYPVASVDHHKAWLGDAPASTRIEDRVYTLVSEGMIEEVAESAYASDGNLLKTWIRLAPASPMAQGRLDDLVTRNMIKFVVDEMDVSGYAYVPKKEQAREEQVREEHAREGEARKGKPLTLGRRDWSREVPMAISQRGQGKPRFVLTTKGRMRLRYALGGSTENLYNWTNLGLVESGRWSIQHQDCAYEFLAQCAEMGCPIAPHWKVKITLADGSRIEPDGAVLVETPLWGKVWCYLEAELSDRTPRAIQPRCERYGSPYRLEDGPLLVVAYNELAEQHFQEAGRLYGLRMLTTTLGRLAESGVAGPGVWSHYGTPVTLRA